MVVLSSLTALPGLSRARSSEVIADEAGRYRSTAISPLDERAAGMEDSIDSEQTGSTLSTLPNLTLEDVLEHRDTLVITSDESILDDSSLIVALESLEPSDGNIEFALVRGADMAALYTDVRLDRSGIAQSFSSNVLLLKSGWAYLALSGSPLELPIETRTDSIDQNWSPWRQSDNGLHEIQDLATGLWSRLVGTRVDLGPKSHEDTAGAYRTTYVSSTSMNTSTSWHDLELSPEGLFSVSYSTLVSSGGLNPDNTFILQLSNSITQRSSTFTGVARSETGATATVNGLRDQLSEHVGDLFGSWEILEDGVTLELSFADGRVERRLFLQSQVGESLSINGDTWWRNADAAPDLLGRLMRLLTDPDGAEGRESWASILAQVELQSGRKQEATAPEPLDRVISDTTVVERS